MVVGVGVEADVVAEPGDTGLGVPRHGAGHVALVRLRAAVHLQRDGEGGRGVEAAALRLGHVQLELLWR